MEDENELRIGPVPEKYLDLRPQDSYDENIEALGTVLDGGYGTVGETAEDMHPRVFHMAFSDLYHLEEGSAKVDSEALEQMQDILEENSGQDRFWPEEKLFDLGYRLGPKNNRANRRRRRNAREKPYIAYGRDMLPDLDTPLPENPVRKGRLKRAGDQHYAEASLRVLAETGDYELEIIQS